MYCRHCGKEINSDAVVCIYCGRYLAVQKQTNLNDTGNIGWGILGFFIPLAGFILYLIWQKDSPKNAKKAGIGALISTCVNVVLFFIFFAMIINLLNSGLFI